MCSHDVIGLVGSPVYTSRIQADQHRIETPADTVTDTLHDDGSATVHNVSACWHLQQVAVKASVHGTMRGDVALGGRWFSLVSMHGQRLASDNLEALYIYGYSLREVPTAKRIATLANLSNTD